ncbi:MAG: hypothetical protein QOG45_1149 [Chloroflexota bacterium]|nr:hypothetical protein [Chloroflexota bacterium]
MHGAELYRGPLEDFVRARAELARRLRSDGDREAAATVAGLRRPSLGAWVVDQLAARAPGLVRDLLAAASDAREAQRQGAPEALREASARVRDLLDEAGRRARGILEQAGHPATDVTVRRARTTAQAAAAGAPAEREALLLGTLDRDLDPPGFGPVGEPEPDTGAVAEAIRDRRRPAPAAAAHRRPAPAPDPGVGADRAAELGEAVQRAERELTGRRRDAERSATAAARRRAHAERLAAEARVAAEEAAAAERAAAADRVGVRRAEEALESAREELLRARPG